MSEKKYDDDTVQRLKCCGNCRFISWSTGEYVCENPIVDLKCVDNATDPTEKGCDKWEIRDS